MPCDLICLPPAFSLPPSLSSFFFLVLLWARRFGVLGK